jgi:putative oxidoreductase
MRTFGNILAWILTIFLGIVFAYAGGIKLIGARPMVQEFAQIGIGQWFRYLTGILEVSGAIGLLVPKYRFWAALQIAVVMACATAVNIVILHAPPLARLTAMLMTLALALAWLRRAHGTVAYSQRPNLAAPGGSNNVV